SHLTYPHSVLACDTQLAVRRIPSTHLAKRDFQSIVRPPKDNLVRFEQHLPVVPLFSGPYRSFDFISHGISFSRLHLKPDRKLMTENGLPKTVNCTVPCPRLPPRLPFAPTGRSSGLRAASATSFSQCSFPSSV